MFGQEKDLESSNDKVKRQGKARAKASHRAARASQVERSEARGRRPALGVLPNVGERKKRPRTAECESRLACGTKTPYGFDLSSTKK